MYKKIGSCIQRSFELLSFNLNTLTLRTETSSFLLICSTSTFGDSLDLINDINPGKRRLTNTHILASLQSLVVNMSSFVHFKFKSQKEPQRVAFDGPFIQVWDLKREIISLARLGDGTDFELKIYNESTNEGKDCIRLFKTVLSLILLEYTDDTDLIHKDSTVLARRLPAAIPGKGRAARYVSGKPPVSAKATASTASRQAGKVIDMNSAQTEEERVKAMFSLNNAQWQQKQEEMAHETRVPISGARPFSKKPTSPKVNLHMATSATDAARKVIALSRGTF